MKDEPERTRFYSSFILSNTIMTENSEDERAHTLARGEKSPHFINFLQEKDFHLTLE
jgi:hypothetical protein